MNRKSLYVTFVDSLGPYLKICGQLNPDAMRIVRTKIQTVLPTCFTTNACNMQAGAMCLAKRYDEICRARITAVMNVENVLQIEYIDYGYMVLVKANEVFIPQIPDTLEQIPPLCSTFIMLGVLSEWSKEDLQEITRLIVHQNLEISIDMELNQFKFIQMKWREFNFAEYLILQKKLGAPVQNEILRDNFIRLLNKSMYTVPAIQGNTLMICNNNNNNISMYTNREIILKNPVRPTTYAAAAPMTNTARYPNAFGSFNSIPQQPVYPQQTIRSPYTMPSQKDLSPRYIRPTPPAPLEAQRSPVKRGQATFKSNTLAVGNIYEVCCSFVENGPCLFSVQLMTEQSKLTDMMTRIESVPLKPFSDKPTLGTACIARYSEDGQLYRALITGVQPTACKVTYIDYGNAEIVQFRDLYEIPEEYLTNKAFAIRFTLSGYKELEPIDESLKKAFKEMVLFKNCTLKVMPLEGPPLVQYCELKVSDKNVLETLRQIQRCRLVFPKAEGLVNNDVVEIRYIDSPKHFYVQKISNIEEFEKMMDDMFVYYNKKQVVPNHLSIGTPCMVKYDNEWYRAEVMRADGMTIVVRHVDFGYEQKVTKNLLSTVSEKHLKLPRQAIHCCLKGFENNEMTRDLATVQFEMLAEESNRTRRSFTVKVFRVQPNGAFLVNLCTKDLNVMKKLYKLSMPFDQYISMEKDEFNTTPNGYERKPQPQQQQQQTPHPIQIQQQQQHQQNHHQQQHQPLEQRKSGNYFNSTALQSGGSDERNVNRNSQASNMSIEWDKNSSSSIENRDSRSSSSEHKTRRYPQHQASQLRGGGGNRGDQRLNKSNSSSDKRSSGYEDNKKDKINYNNKNKNMPPRFLNSKMQQDSSYVDNRRPKGGNIQKGQDRPFYTAEGGYSQSSKKQNSTTSSQRDSTEDNGILEITVLEEYVPIDKEFIRQNIDVPAREEVIICWWISPHQFYTHLKSRTQEFEKLMKKIQEHYRNKPSRQIPLKVGANVIARYRKDNILYRARVIACNQMLRKYKVIFVDFGNQSTVGDQDIFQVEKRFSDFPQMAYPCCFDNIVCNYESSHIIQCMEKYLPIGAGLHCEYLDREDDMYYVNINVNGVSLKNSLVKDGLLSEISPDIRLELLPGQQIRAKITSINTMLNFKIQIEGCDVDLLCSYDDVRFVKSNPITAQKFKDFYEGKSCVLNISHLTDDKVIVLRPLLPLLLDDISTIYICPIPLIWEKFKIRVVYVSSVHRLYGHLISTEDEVHQLLDDLFSYYDKSGDPIDRYQIDNMCAVKSEDGNWYRARILSKKSAHTVNVLYVDYGNTELIDNTTKTKIKRLEPQFYTDGGPSAFGIELNIPMRSCLQENKTQTVIDEIKNLTSDLELTVKVIEMRQNRLICDLCSGEKNIVSILKEKGFTRGRDVGYIRSLIDKEPPKLFEYIETVDLTETDEEQTLVASPDSTMTEREKVNANLMKIEKIVAKAKAMANSPRKEKQTEKVAIVPAESTAPTVEAKETVSSSASAPAVSAADPVEDPFKHMESGMLSHCDNPGRFFIHHKSKLDELHKLQENLQIVASSLPPLMRIIKGANCISLYSVDHQWYRAKIMDSELMVVQFIDYGNTDALSDTTDIKEMSVFPDIEPLCIPCALAIKPKGTADWVDAANAFFNVSYTKTIHFEYITKSPTKNFIRLFIDGVDVANKLIEDGFAKPLEMVRSGETCFVSHINNLSDFYIQMEQDAKGLGLIESYLADNEQLPEIETFTRGLICAALFPDDENWYRAKLLAKKDDGFEVLFIDYGNTAISPKVKEISQDIADLPFLSKKCALQLPEDLASWSEAAEEKFSDISALGETVFVVELKEPSDHAIVHLSIDGKNIIEDLEPLCQKKPSSDEINTSFYTTMQSSMSESYSTGVRDATISHANSPCDFYIQYNSDGHKLDDMTTTLNEIGMSKLENPEVGTLCAAVFPDDGALYRSKVLEVCGENGCRVVFIDFGNESMTQDLRVLPDDLRCMKAFSKHCSLENAEKFSSISASVDVFNLLIDECGGIVKIDLLNDECTPALIKLFANGENVCEKLNRLLGIEGNAEESPIKDALVSHVNSPSEFYIQLKFERVELERISKVLEKAGDMAKLENPKQGDLCAVFSKEDEIYNRGRVVRNICGKDFEVFLIDFGNTVVVDDLREISPELKGLQGIARKCRLHDIPECDETKLKEQFSSILDAYFGDIFQVEVVSNDDETLSVNLSIRDKNISEELKAAVENGKVESEAAPLDECRKCTVIHVTSPNDFYIQFTDDGPQVEKITESLMDAHNFEPLEDIHVGAICIAQFPDDEAYYRAKILSIHDKDCEVIYLDFGNTAVTDQLRKIPDEMRNIEPAGKHCALEKPAGVDFWSDEVSYRFSELIDSRFSETFQVEVLRKSTDPQLVRLFYQETNILTELQNKPSVNDEENSKNGEEETTQ
ncbi:maternal protein tudor [Eupeodes corollae]|uniref:maternal protein tudor n=1 Tax=Eupeodes corollae TaxID=290404 RepID=UPI002493815F|nr:maternal protein tudor [Eupeodes corollae]